MPKNQKWRAGVQVNARLTAASAMQADDLILASGHGNSADAGPTAGVAGVAAVPTVQVPELGLKSS